MFVTKAKQSKAKQSKERRCAFSFFLSFVFFSFSLSLSQNAKKKWQTYPRGGFAKSTSRFSIHNLCLHRSRRGINGHLLEKIREFEPLVPVLLHNELASLSLRERVCASERHFFVSFSFLFSSSSSSSSGERWGVWGFASNAHRHVRFLLHATEGYYR